MDVALNPQRGTPGTERLVVYAEGYQVRIQQALAELYPAIRHILGGKTFAAMSEAYAARHPSHDTNLSFMGRYLPEFLVTYSLTRELPFIADLARLEWLVSRAFHAFDQPPLDPAQLSTRSPDQWERLRFAFQPSIGLVASSSPVLDLWEARNRPRADINIDLVNRPQRVLVSRRDLQVRCELIEPPQYAVLEGLLGGQTLGAVCRTLSERSRRESLAIQQWFARWRQAGFIVGCSAEPVRG